MTINFETFVRTRHAMWLEKTYGVPIETYLDDLTAYELMRGHRYTNIWRELDRGTLDVVRLQEKYMTISTLKYAVYHTLLYRFFNSITGYYRFLQAVLDAGESIADPSEETINVVLDHAGNFSGAYIRTVQRSIAVKALRSLADHAVNIAAEIENYELAVALEDADAVAVARDLVRSAFGAVPSFGDFLADQLMLDFCGQGNQWRLRFEPSLGPGAKRGLKRTGMTFAEAIDAGQRGLEGMPVPYIESSSVYPGHSVNFDAVEAEHQLCEAEKLWKIMDAKAEGEGRQVKMRKYDGTVKPKLDQVLPTNWKMPDSLTN